MWEMHMDVNDDVGPHMHRRRGRGHRRRGGGRAQFKYTQAMREDLGDRYQEDAHRERTTGQYKMQIKKFRVRILGKDADYSP
jgi:hypothetical protein